MNTPNLFLKFEVNGERGVKIKQANRIKIDGRGSLLVYGNSAVTPSRISLDGIRAFSIQSFAGSGRWLQPHIMGVPDALGPFPTKSSRVSVRP